MFPVVYVKNIFFLYIQLSFTSLKIKVPHQKGCQSDYQFREGVLRAGNNYCSLDKLPTKPAYVSLEQFDTIFTTLSCYGPCSYQFAYARRAYANIFSRVYPTEKEPLWVRILKRFTLFVGSLSAELICLPLKCVKLCPV